MIEVKNITKKYGNFYAIRNVNFEVREGEIVGFLGRNGAGKSTTMNIITGFIEPTSGDVLVNGYSIVNEAKHVKRQIGYMPEGTPLYSELTVKEFVTYMAQLKLVPRKKIKDAVAKAIESCGLEIVKDNLTKNLSRGYKQRVSFAGAIVGDPRILILDEPTVGLDPKQVVEIRDLIKNYGKEHTVLISSHILSEISQLCDKVVIIDKGEIVAVDSPEKLETQTSKETVLNVTVDDINNKMLVLKDDIKEIVDIKLITENEDKTKEYAIRISSKEDIRKKIFASCAKNDISIVEMKKNENSLEDAFIKIVENRPEISQREIEKIQYNKEIEELRKEEQEEKELKANYKKAKEEEKARKKAKKEAKKSKEEKKEDKKDEEGGNK